MSENCKQKKFARTRIRTKSDLSSARSHAYISEKDRAEEHYIFSSSRKTDLPNGRVYEGSMKNGKREGRGRIVDENRRVVYDGNWRNGLEHGYGITNFIGSGDRHEGGYAFGKRDGLGVFKWSNGNRYSGYFSSGNMHGYGRFDWLCGDTYCGMWEMGFASGEGVAIKADGSRWEGEFYRGELHGFGKKVLKNGDILSGFFTNGILNGYGVRNYYRDGKTYEGQWRDGEYHGIGQLTEVSTKLAGEPVFSRGISEFNHNIEQGVGSIEWPEVMQYSGEVASDRKDNNHCIAWGRITLPNGIEYEGECVNHCKQGWGQMKSLELSNIEPEIALEDLLVQDLNIEQLLIRKGGIFIGVFDKDTAIYGTWFLPTGEEVEMEL